MTCCAAPGLSTLFDTIEHGLLLQRFELENSTKGPALAWFCFCLAERCQHLTVNFEASANTALQCGVPQGFVLGPILFTIYTARLGQVIDRYQIDGQHF